MPEVEAAAIRWLGAPRLDCALYCDLLAREADERGWGVSERFPDPASEGIPLRRTVSAVLVDSVGRVLLEHRPWSASVTPGKWDTPGGHVEAGEDEGAALRRELVEELGIAMERASPWSVYRAFEPPRFDHYEHHVYLVRDWAGSLSDLDPRRFQWREALAWLDDPALNPWLKPVLGRLTPPKSASS